MMNTYDILFQPIKIGNVEIKNRIGMSPMAMAGMISSDNCFTQRTENFYVERAKGGAGLIITGSVEIENEIEKSFPGVAANVTTSPYRFAIAASELTERVHAYGTKIFLQLIFGYGRVAPDTWVKDQPVAPSAIPNFWNPEIICRPLTISEIENLVEKMGQAAKIAQDTGFDGVEVHAVHEGYLLDQFALEVFNKRTDKYGGSLENRLRVPSEVVQSIKAHTKGDYPVLLRYSIKSFMKDWGQGGLPGEDFVEMGRDLPEGLEAAKILEKAGYDGFNADCGTYEGYYWAHPPGYMSHGLYLPYTEELKKAVNVPVLSAGRLEIPHLAASAVADNKADIILLGRGLLADPEWTNKVMYDELHKIRPCVGCHDGCMGRCEDSQNVTCAVNPACGREEEYRLFPAPKKKNIMVIGGGVAGMEISRVAALRGHQVSLYEKRSDLGGHVIEASIPSFKEDERRLIDWYKQELEELDVKVNLNHAADIELVKSENPDEVILATGALEKYPLIRGIDHECVYSACEILTNPDKCGEKVVIIGGGLVGCEVAMWLREQSKNKEITIVEAEDRLLPSGFLCYANKSMLLDSLNQMGIETITDTFVEEIGWDTILLKDLSDSRVIQLRMDTVIMATGYREDTSLYQELVNLKKRTHLIGDSNKASNILNAIWQGYEVGRNL